MAVYAKAEFDFEATEKGDLSFNEGDTIEVLEQTGDWWRGRLKGREGYFPFNRVKVKPNRPSVTPSSEIFTNVQRRPASETIRRVKVELNTPPTDKLGVTFSLSITLANGKAISTNRQMSDFRKLNNAFVLLVPDVSLEYPPTPPWGDDVPISEIEARRRAKVLNKFLSDNKKVKDLFDLLILTWATSRKKDLKEGKKSMFVTLSSKDPKDTVIDKMKKALNYQYQKERLSPTIFFRGKEKVGDLTQALFEWVARDDTELSLIKNEFVLVLQKKTRYDGWWFGELPNGEKGLFPQNYVKEYDASLLASNNIGQKGKKDTFSPQADAPPTRRKKSRVPKVRSPGSRSPQKMRSPTSKSPGKYRSPNSKSPEKYKSPISRSNSRMGDTSFLYDNTALFKSKTSFSSSRSLNKIPEAARDRKIIQDFSVSSIDAYDDLRTHGITVQLNGKYVKFNKRNPPGPKTGERVTIFFSAYVWDPQTQTLREFSSSDKLKAPPRGVSSGTAGKSGFLIKFVVGDGEVIEGLEDAVTQLELNKKYRVVIAASKGYGDVGSPPEIPANCFLVYDLTLQEVAGKGKYQPVDRRNVFSVGISKPNVTKKPQRSVKVVKRRRRKARSRAGASPPSRLPEVRRY